MYKLIYILLIIILFSCQKEDDFDFEQAYSDLIIESESVNFIFPPQKYKVALITNPGISYYYTINGIEPTMNEGTLYNDTTGIQLSEGVYTIKIAMYHDGIKSDNIAEQKYIIQSIDVINLVMTREQEQNVLDSRDEKIVITDPDPELEFKNQIYKLDKLQTRGKSALRMRRKSFSVHLDKFIHIEDRQYSGKYKSLKKFKLISMVHDYTYIENRIAIGLMQKIDLWKLFYKYVEVRINDNTQGVYLLIEDPEEYALDNFASEYVLRRGYRGSILGYDYESLVYNLPREKYEEAFKNIYSYITMNDSIVLYDSLSNTMNIDNYFRKMAIDYLLKNGDLTDEVYFYSLILNNKDIYYDIIPWDYDDLFAEFPHEVAADWGIGNLFGIRNYESMEDVINDVGYKHIFSIEDDLDYKIAKDDYIYSRYLIVLEDVLETIDDNYINQVFQDIKNELSPFYDNYPVIEQSRYDRDSTNYELYMQNRTEKLNFILERRAQILSEIK